MIAVLGSILKPSAEVLNTWDPAPLFSAFLLTLALDFIYLFNLPLGFIHFYMLMIIFLKNKISSVLNFINRKFN